MAKNLQEEVNDFLTKARDCVAVADYANAAEYYKAALRRIRDELGPADLLIADVFEELALVHAATGKHPKCESIRRRVGKIRFLHKSN